MNWCQLITYTCLYSQAFHCEKSWYCLTYFDVLLSDRAHSAMTTAAPGTQAPPPDIQGIFYFNTLRLRQNVRHFPNDISNWIFLNENVWILIKISLDFVPRGPINNIPSLVQIMAWRWPGDKPLSDPMMVSLLTHICVTRPQWVNLLAPEKFQF